MSYREVRPGCGASHTYPFTAHYNLYALMMSTPPMAGTLPLTLPSFTVLGQPSLNPATSVSAFTGQIQPNQPISRTLNVPANTALHGLALDVQGLDNNHNGVSSHALGVDAGNDLLALLGEQWTGGNYKIVATEFRWISGA